MFFKGKEIDIAPEFNAGFMIHNRNGNYYNITASGLSEGSKKDYYTWINSPMDVGDEIEIEIADLDESSEPESIKKIFSDPKFIAENEIKEMWAEKLDHFCGLEQVLIKEGILTINDERV